MVAYSRRLEFHACGHFVEHYWAQLSNITDSETDSGVETEF